MSDVVRNLVRNVGLAALIAAASLCGGFGTAGAGDFEKLIMPGDLVRSHAEFESDCSRCHKAFRLAHQDALCLDCHDEVRDDLRGGVGFHGLAPVVSGSPCRTCHPDHKGRNADVAGLNREVFDHELTDHPLVGAHTDARCDQCHQAGVKLRDAPKDCATCHRVDDPHGGRLGEKCDGCHSQSAWRPARFDHDRTAFPLVGEHAGAECGLCHPNERYRDTAQDCFSCHSREDAHVGRFGSDCSTCHEPGGWVPVRFDHDHDTGFRLAGRHRGLGCESCHTSKSRTLAIETDCVSCHRADDDHRGQNGSDCAACHDATSWSSARFDHDRMTDFALHGAHQSAACGKCHRGDLREEKLASSCHSCHSADDVHRGQEGERCSVCHNEGGWSQRVFFDHDITRFPLLGLHAVGTCDQCHLSPRFKDADESCVSCHSGDDAHRSRLGPDCELCHNPNGWRVWRFDHDSQTGFPLRGAHEGLDCHTCHQRPAADSDGVAVAGGCGSCHARDDVHQGSYGRSCSRCHGETSWRELRMSR